MLGAHRVMTRGEGDCNVVKSKHGSIEADFRAWKTKFISQLQVLCKGEKKSCDGNCKKGKCESNQRSSEEMELGSHTQDGLHQRDPEVCSLCVHVSSFLLCLEMLNLTSALRNYLFGYWLEGRSGTHVGVF